ncbi:MAG: hypothetical protein IT576_13555 [Verrucomicrobiales bacterium]|nr:hypothetical protein [Verrucomicrobiales bacterium]
MSIDPNIRIYVEPPPLARVLRYGMSGADVKALQALLKDQGFFDGDPRGNFLEKTLAGVNYFQNTHIGRDGNFLEADGVVGGKTWWSLHNPSGSAQRNHIEPQPATVEDSPRIDVLKFLQRLYAKGVREIPDGSNWGDGVETIIRACGFSEGIAWCLALQSYADLETFGDGPLGGMPVHCATFWNEATRWGRAFRKENYQPLPGDIGIYNYGNPRAKSLSGPGHAVRVAAVSYDGSKFNTFAGNEGNRLKYGLRRTSEASLVGFVNLFHDEKVRPKFRPGVTDAPEIPLSLQGTR